MRNSEYFDCEIGWIQDPTLKSFTLKYVDFFPDYFEVKPASSTGKHHASWSNEIGGLRSHTKGVAYFTHELSDAYGLTEIEHDAALVAAIGHDAVKYGIQGTLRTPHTTKSHAAEGAMFFLRVAKALNATNMPCCNEIYTAIADHMGRWGEGERSFPENFSKVSQLVHVADMAASRKEVKFTFVEPQGSLIG